MSPLGKSASPALLLSRPPEAGGFFTDGMHASPLLPRPPAPNLSALNGSRNYFSALIKNETHPYSPKITPGGGTTSDPRIEDQTPAIRARLHLIGGGNPEKKFPSLRHLHTLVPLCVFQTIRNVKAAGLSLPAVLPSTIRGPGRNCPLPPFCRFQVSRVAGDVCYRADLAFLFSIKPRFIMR